MRPWNPIHLVYRLGAAALIAVFLGCALPGIVAYRDHVFFKFEMRTRVAEKNPKVVSDLVAHEAFQNRTKDLVASLDALPIANAGATLTDRATLRQSYLRSLSEPEPFSLQPFYLHIIMFFWPIMYFGLFAAIFVLRPPGSRLVVKDFFDVSNLMLALGLFSCSIVPLLFRTLIATSPSDGRKVCAYSNPDVSVPCFVLQLVNFAIFSLALAAIWRQWTSYSERQSTALAMVADKQQLDPWLAEEVIAGLFRFQAAFIVISGGFVIYTGIFWTQIVRHHDMRFLAEGIAAHLLWFSTIAIVATPLGLTWYAWRRHKSNLLLKLINETDPSLEGSDARAALISDFDPIPKWNLMASLVAVLTSIAGPFLQAFIR